MSAATLLALLPRCPLRALVGLPCPTCGASRAVAALLAGHPGAALAYNPGVLLGGAGFLVFLGRGLWQEWRTGSFPAGPPRDARARRRLALRAVVLVAANWTWVLWHESTLGAP